jgi:hypothetical protein
MRWPLRSNRRKAPQPDLYHELREEIPQFRKQGELPARDSSSFSKYFCDLCNTPYALHELRQCTICGRWACSTCWTTEYYICNSCNGILKMHQARSRD